MRYSLALLSLIVFISNPAVANSLFGGGSKSGSSADMQVAELEEQMRALKGKLEENEFAVNNIAKKVDKIIADMDFRITAIEKKLNEAPAPSAAATDAAPATAPSETNAPVTLPLENEKKSDATGDVNLSGNSQEQYDAAFQFLRKGEYDKAEKALKTFIDGNKDSALLSNAYYWLGETYYVRENYEPAAVNFLKGYQGWPKGNKAADNLMKLAMSLDKMKKKKESCTTFDKVTKEFPDADASIKDKITSEKKRIGC